MAKHLKPREISRSYNLLHVKEKRKLGLFVAVQILLSFLDLIGIFMLGILISVAVNDNQNSKSQEWFDLLINNLGLATQSDTAQLLVVTALSVSILVLKSIFSILFTRQIFTFFSNFGAELSGKLIRNILQSKIVKIRNFTTQEITYSSTRGVEIITLDILANIVVIIADVIFLLIIAAGLFYLDFATALSVIFMFASAGIVLFYSLQRYILNLGREVTELNLESNEKILEAFSSPRENHVKGNQNFYADKILNIRRKVSKTMVGIYFVPYLSKYVIEMTIIFGGLIYGILISYISSGSNIAETSALFIVAATRAAPSALRIQQGLLQIKAAIGKSSETLRLIETFNTKVILKTHKENEVSINEFFSPSIEISNISFKYPMQEDFAIKDVNLNIESGTTVAIVGPSGSGKSTLVDCILGILDPDVGEILISGKSPDAAIRLWPGEIAYVPQETYIINDTLLENIVIGTNEFEQAKRSVSKAIDSASLTEFVSSLPEGLSTVLGERGSRLSGGQKQRVGIARAIYSDPSLLILDEATSALDDETENAISNSLFSEKGSRTLLIVAHRMTSVLKADLIVYLESGIVKASGTLEYVMNAIPDFQNTIQSLSAELQTKELE